MFASLKCWQRDPPYDRRGSRGVIGATLMSLALFSSSTTAQVVRGTVIEQGTNAKLAAVRIKVFNEMRDSAVALSTQGGEFTLRMPKPGRYRIRAERIGYAVTETPPFDVTSGQEAMVTVILGVSAIPLEPLRIESYRVPLQPHIADIEERRKQGFGRFITRDQIEAKANPNLMELLRAVPGVRVSESGFGDLVTQIRARPGFFQIPDFLEEDEKAFLAHNQCPVKLYLDGIPWFRPHTIMPDPGSDKGDLQANIREARSRFRDFLTMAGQDIEVVEVYNGSASVPGIYSGTDAACGVIAAWTKRPGPAHVWNSAPLEDSTPSWLARPQVTVGFGALHLSGNLAPGSGVAAEGTALWTIHRVGIGLTTRASTHQLSGGTTERLTSGLSTTEYRLPPGSRGLMLWSMGVEPRMAFRRDEQIRPIVAMRLLAARRSFGMPTTTVNEPVVTVTSFGWGVGSTVGIEMPINSRTALNVALGRDWFRFGPYKRIERHWNPTAANWSGTTLRIGVGYNFAQ
jgi:hypothetical protein